MEGGKGQRVDGDGGRNTWARRRPIWDQQRHLVLQCQSVSSLPRLSGKQLGSFQSPSTGKCAMEEEEEGQERGGKERGGGEEEGRRGKEETARRQGAEEEGTMRSQTSSGCPFLAV